MRQYILDYIAGVMVTGFRLTQELPWDKDSGPLYLTNMKTVYVDSAQTSQDPLIDVLNGAGIVNETTTISAYVVTDAKILPPGYANLVTAISGTRLDPAITGYTQKTTAVNTSFQADAQITEFVFNFTKVIVNSQ
tara:strand:- start:210 stop:614 length:405 start_codon:yes stop_codon:yes gene_type:complete